MSAILEMTLEGAKAWFTPEAKTRRGPGRPNRMEAQFLKVAKHILAENGLSTNLTPIRGARTAAAANRDDEIDNFINSLDLRERNYIRETLGEMEIDEEISDVEEVISEIPSETPSESLVPSVVFEPTW